MSVIHLSDWLLVMGVSVRLTRFQIWIVYAGPSYTIFWEQETHLLKNVEVV